MPQIVIKGGEVIELTPDQWVKFAAIYMTTPLGVDKAIVKKDGKIYKISDLADPEEIQKLKQKVLDI